MRLGLLALVAGSMLAALVCAAPAGAGGYTSGFEERTIVGGLDEPVSMSWAPDGRLFIIEKPGRLKVAAPGATQATTILDISDEVNNYNDRGLLGLAVDSNFASNGYLYLSYTYELQPLIRDSDAPMVSRVVRYTIGANNLVSARQVVLGSYGSGPCPAASNALDCMPSDGLSHSIGTVLSAPDGTLWIGSGDAADYNVVDPLAFRTYDERSMAGKIFHVDRDGRGLSGHPLCPGDGDLTHVCTKVHSMGFRNPFRFKLRPNGSLAVGDVGWSTREEVDLIAAAGKSYGWPCYEGNTRTPGYKDRSQCMSEYAKEGTAAAHVGPQHDYPHGGSGNAVMAGGEYGGHDYPAGYRGDVFFADYSEGFIRRLKLGASGQVTSVEPFATGWLGVDLKAAPNGDLAFPDFMGSIKRIVYTPGNGSPNAVLGATPTSGRAPLAVRFDAAGSSDPNGDALSYDWDFGDGTPHSSAPSPSHTYVQGGVHTARLTVSDGRGLNDTKTTTISVNSDFPTANIASPADESLYRDGQTIQLHGTATDPEDGTLPASAYRWTVRLHHNQHVHLLNTFTGVNPSFTALTDHDADSFYEVELTVTDSDGLTDSRTIEVRPETVGLTLEGAPHGAPLSYSGIAGTAPMVRTAAIGYRTTVSAGERFVSGGREWIFDHWSDGGARAHDVTVPASTTTLTAHYRDAGPAPGLVAALAFEEGSGVATADATGRGNHGTISGAAWIPDGRYGSALALDGVDDWVTLADSPSLDLTTGLTLEAWVKPGTLVKPWQTLLMKEAPGALAYALYATGGGSPQLNAWWGDQQSLYTTDPLPVGEWSHVAVTSDGATMRAYLNGLLAESVPVTGPLAATSGPLRIGGNAVWENEFFQGVIDEVRIYDRALSAEEVRDDQDAAIGGGPPSAGGPPPGGGPPQGGVGPPAPTAPSSGAQPPTVPATPPAPAAKPDVTPPLVRITIPTRRTVVSGRVAVRALVSDNVGVRTVEFRLDGKRLGKADASAPFRMLWNTRAVKNGTRRVTAVARDAAGNATTSRAVRVMVRNERRRASRHPRSLR